MNQPINLIQLAGHRGFGQTDSAHARGLRDVENLPAENTSDSFVAAFGAGARFVELDAVRTKDGVVVVTHTSNLAEHVFGQELPARFVDELDCVDLQKLKCGTNGVGEIPKLIDVLSWCAHNVPGNDVCVNIEIKDVKGTQRVRRSITADVAATVKKSPLPLSRVLFSSFATIDLVEMRTLLPQAKLGQLFIEPMGASRAIYSDSDAARYLPFTADNLARVQAQVPLYALVIEIGTLSLDLAQKAVANGLEVIGWEWQRAAPQKEDALWRTWLSVAKQVPGRYTLITDYLKEAQAWLQAQAKSETI